MVVSLLPPVIAAVTDARKMLVEESRRPDGPRSAGDKAEIDIEIEEFLADALTAIMPCRLVGEEAGSGREMDRTPAGSWTRTMAHVAGCRDIATPRFPSRSFRRANRFWAWFVRP